MRPERRVPVGRLKRLSRLARMGSEAGARLMLSNDDALAAERLAEAFGSLRGLAAKLGQMASYIDGLVPEAHEAAFEEALRELCAKAPPSPAPLVRARVESELGASMDELFAAWEDEPFASASIGQVHRAKLFDGRNVAVKVQHPGIDRAIEDDLANGALLARWVGALAPGALEPDRLYAEVARHFREELDYRREAAWQERFARLHECDRRILVPKIISERSSQRVLSSELMQGDDLESSMRRPEAERRRIAEILWGFVYRSILQAGIFNADPHPGNYLFRPEGIVFLDFGCVQELSPEVQQGSRLAHAAALVRDERAFARHAAAIVEARGGPYEAVFVAYLRQTLEPIWSSPYRITRGYVRELFQGLLKLRRCAFSRKSQFVPLPESTVLLNRLHFGFFSVLARLDVEVDYAAVERQLL
jgi:predicted unusual protein kinase regulating ubiquinone biosynthesis (AarF/ABC1/UbiB family)